MVEHCKERGVKRVRRRYNDLCRLMRGASIYAYLFEKTWRFPGEKRP